MKTLGLFDLKDQLYVLLSIKNPSQWICLAIDKLTEQISAIEFAQKEDYFIKVAINEIELIAAKYPDLRIYYSNNHKDKQPVNSFDNPASSQNTTNHIPARKSKSQSVKVKLPITNVNAKVKSNNEVIVDQILWL
ncbi:MAG: hypothetical protein IH949_12275 [Bacteroidetes bacterium]|nr:hypothetical protein [Bacteroidota bacterium]